MSLVYDNTWLIGVFVILIRVDFLNCLMLDGKLLNILRILDSLIWPRVGYVVEYSLWF